jgi:flagellar biosynthesis protein FlhG
MCEILAFTGPKEPQGKPCLALNAAVAIGNTGATVLLLEMNASVANAGTVEGLQLRYNLNDLVWGYCSAEEVIVPCAENVSLVSVGEAIGWNGENMMARFLSLAPHLDQKNLVLLDALSVNGESLSRLLAGNVHVLAVVTPEQVANGEAHAFIMNLHQMTCGRHIYLILNRALSSEISELMCNRLEHDFGKVLEIPITCLGYVPDEPLVAAAAQAQSPLLTIAPESDVSSSLAHVAGAISEICGKQPRERSSERFLWDLFLSLGDDKQVVPAVESELSVNTGFPRTSKEEVELFRQIILQALDSDKADSLDFTTMYQHVREVVETSNRTRLADLSFPSPTA